MIILWRDNFSLDSEKLDKVIQETIKHPECSTGFNLDKFLYTTFFIDDLFEHPEIVFLEEYKDIISKYMNEMGLLKKTNYNFSHWMQVYNNGHLGHPAHDHFRYDTFFSWVHFVKPVKKKLFFFIDSDGKKVYPECQTPGDFIVFPSWAEHGVDPFDESADEQRAIIAGNISVTMVNRLYGETAKCHKVSKTIDVVEYS